MPSTPQGRRIIARTALVASVITVGLLGVIVGVFDPFGQQDRRAIERANDAVAVAICINRQAFRQRLDGLGPGDGDVATSNLRHVLEDGIRRQEEALALINRTCMDARDAIQEDTSQ